MTKVNGVKVFCVGNSSYNFMPIPLKLYRSLENGMHIIWIKSSGYFCYFFSQVKLIHFIAKQNGFNVFCVGSSSYSFMPLPLKLYRCLGHGLKMCISFGYTPQVIFRLFF